MLGRMMKAMHGPVYRRRLEVLSAMIAERLRENDRVLDVGCGGGALGTAILAHPKCPRGVTVTGLERAVRGGEPIPVVAYDGIRMPLDDKSFDVVIVADVLHHEEQPERLLAEVRRVCRGHLFFKDHQICGVLGLQRISLIDWAANAPYGVPCLYRYHRPAEWAERWSRAGFVPEHEWRSIDLYPAGFNRAFGRRLQYAAWLRAT